jgi:formylglycine-generating enzyme required for sulfatase activity
MIVEALNSSSAVVLILTEHAQHSPHVLTEIGQAFDEKKPIIPFRLSAVTLSPDFDYYLGLKQWLDATDGLTETNLDRLVAAVRNAISGRREVGREGRGKRRIALWAATGFAAAALTGGVLYWKWPRPAAVPPQNQTQTKVANSITPEKALPRADSGPPLVNPPAETSPSRPKTRIDAQNGLTYVWIPPGRFTMGCSPGDDQCKSNEKPAHLVIIRNGFWIGQTEVTVAAYAAFRRARGLTPPSGNGNLPVTEVTWAGARKFCEASGGRLPTEAEWEYAARAGSTQPYYGVVSDIAWYERNSGGERQPVRRKEPNAFGLYDMLGNVYEWVLDRYYNRLYPEAAHTAAAVDLPLADNAFATIRGGFFAGSLVAIRLSHRSEMYPDAADPIIGFRCVADRP